MRIVPIPSIAETSSSPGKGTGAGTGGADAGGCAREDEVAGQQRCHRRQQVDQGVGAEDEVRGSALLDFLAVHGAPELEVVGVVELVWGDNPRPGRAEAGERLAEAELRRRRPGLHDPLGEVLADGDAGDMRPAVAAGDLEGVPADDEHELHLPVDEPARQLDRDVRPGEAGRELGERGRELGDVQAGLGGVAGVVDADGEDLPGTGHRREEDTGTSGPVGVDGADHARNSSHRS